MKLLGLDSIFEAYILKNTPFSRIASVENEQSKLNFFRILTGLVLLYPIGMLIYHSYYFYDPVVIAGLQCPLQTWAAIGMLFLVLLFTIGFATPITTLLLTGLFLPFSHYQNITHLGTAVLQMLLTLFLMVNVGSRFSVDQLILSRPKHFLYPVIHRLYNLLGLPNRHQVGAIYFLVFCTYGLISLAALMHHFNDEFWSTGQTVQLMLLNAYMSRFYTCFRWIEQVAPALLGSFSLLTIMVQSFFQAAMIPLVYTRWGRIFVVGWGTAFFLGSALFLQLSYLPYMEFILWGILFLPTSQAYPVQMLFDDRCGLCHASRKVLMCLDPLNYYQFLPLSKSEAVLSDYGLTHESASEALCGIYQGRVYKGFYLYEVLARRNPVLWLVWPLFLLLKIGRTGETVYQFIAARRQQISQVCALAVEPIESGELVWKVRSKVIQRAFLTLFVGAQFVFLLNFMPLSGGVFWSPPVLSVLEYFGLIYPNVFNKLDLSTGNIWFVVRRTPLGGQEALVPLNGLSGERLEYHNSDLLFYGPSLQWKAGLLRSPDPSQYMQPDQPGFMWLAKLIQFDYRIQHFKVPVNYQVDVYEANATNLKETNLQERYRPKVMQQFALTYQGTSVK